MKKRFFSIFCLLLTLLLASCDLLGGSLSDYITEYTKNAALESYDVQGGYPRNSKGTLCIDPAAYVSLYFRNPQAYNISLEYEFSDESVKQAYAYYLNQEEGTPIQFFSQSEDNNYYVMHFPDDFIYKLDTLYYRNGDLECKSKNISGTVHAYEAETQRDFGSMELKLSADTVPEKYSRAQLQLDRSPAEDADNAMYILVFQIPHMERNNDFATIQINNDIWNVEYDQWRDYYQTGYNLTPSSKNKGTLLVNPEQPDPYAGPDDPQPENPAPTLYPLEEGGDVFEVDIGYSGVDYDTFYYLTKDVLSGKTLSYTVTITDEAGLSQSGTISNKAEKLSPVIFTTAPAAGSTQVAGNNGYYNLTIKHNGKTTEGNAIPNKNDIQITYEIRDDDSGLVESKTVPLNNGTQSISIAIGSNYTVTAKASLSGYLSSTLVTSNTFSIIHSKQFFVSKDGDDDAINGGTYLVPFKTFDRCIEAITDYQDMLEADYPSFVPLDGYYINVMTDMIAEDGLTGPMISNGDFHGKLTIVGILTDDVKPVIDGDDRAKLLEWTDNELLTLRDLKFTKASTAQAALLFNYASNHEALDEDKFNAQIICCEIANNPKAGIEIRAKKEAMDEVVSANVIIQDCAIALNYDSGVYLNAQKNTDVKLTVTGLTFITNNETSTNGGGIKLDGGKTCIEDSVIITDNKTTSSTGKGAGVYIDGYTNLILKGGSVYNNWRNEDPSNLFIPYNSYISVQSKLTNSTIGVSYGLEGQDGGEPQSAEDPPVAFAELKAGTPKQDAFFSDRGKAIIYGGGAASIGFMTANATGTIIAQTYDDIRVALTFQPITAWGTTGTLTITDAEGTDITSAVTIKNAFMSYHGSTIDKTDAQSYSMWNFANYKLTLSDAFHNRCFSTAATPTFTIIFEYNGNAYSCDFLLTCTQVDPQ